MNRGFRTETGNALDPRTASSDGDHEDLVEGSITDRFEGIGDDDVDEDDE